MKHFITLPNQRNVSVGAYAAAWKAIKQAPTKHFPGFQHFPARGSEILAAMSAGLHDRINQRIPAFGRGRKWSCDEQANLMRLASAVNTPRLIVRRAAHSGEARRLIDSRLFHRVEA